jgi:hypothetical protein
MKIGIDVSQLAYKDTGVANYLQNFVQNLIKTDNENEYVLFFSSMRKKFPSSGFGLSGKSNVTIKQFKIPPAALDILWNKLHIMPVENFIGPVDVFITSDWTEPPVRKAKKATILYDLIVYKYPQETHKKIVDVQKRKLNWVKKETDKIFCISKSTADDAQQILGMDKDKLSVIYPGV